jgi:hypothetical protein
MYSTTVNTTRINYTVPISFPISTRHRAAKLLASSSSTVSASVTDIHAVTLWVDEAISHRIG